MARSRLDRGLAEEIRTARRQRLLGEDAQCLSCGESDPFALRRQQNGRVICYRCAALEKAPRLAKPDPLAFLRPQCTACGFSAPPDVDDAGLFELHHVAGRVRHDKDVTRLCLNCHHKVTEAQRALGVELRGEATRDLRVVHALVSSLALVGVALEQVEPEAMSWREGFKAIAPSVMAGLKAVLRVHYNEARFRKGGNDDSSYRG